MGLAFTAGIVILALIAVSVLAFWTVFTLPIGENHRRGPADQRRIALTFDDGPNPPYTENILDVLRERDVRATFFMTGKHVEAHPETARRVLDDGHQIGNHSWDDALLAFHSPSFVRSHIERTDRVLRGVGVEGAIDFRAPRLMRGWTGSWVLYRDRRRHIATLVDGQDWLVQDHERIANRILERVKPGSIVLMHDGLDKQDGCDRSTTVAALRKVLDGVEARGLRCVTVSELIAAKTAGSV